MLTLCFPYVDVATSLIFFFFYFLLPACDCVNRFIVSSSCTTVIFPSPYCILRNV